MTKLTKEDICQQVRSCLIKMKLNDAIIDGVYLHASDYDDIKKVDPDKTLLNVFLDYVSGSLKMTKKVNRARDQLDGMMEVILEEIQAFDPATYSDGADRGTAVVAATEMNQVIGSKRRHRSCSAKEPKKKKGRTRMSYTFDRRDDEIPLAAQMRSDYAEKRAEIEGRLDKEYTKYFGAIAFARWQRDPRRPVVLLGPYAVPPRLRETWMKMYENTHGDPKRMWYFCYWYGSPLIGAYTYTTLQDVTLYEAAERRGIHKIDKEIVAKVEGGKKLSKVDQEVFDGFEMLEHELAKKPEERIPELFREDFEVMLDTADELSLDGDELVQSFGLTNNHGDDVARRTTLDKATVAENAVDEEKESKRRRRFISKAEPKKKNGNQSKIFTSLKKIETVQLAEQVKSHYAERRAEIENDLDEGYKKYFGAIAISKWKKNPRRPVVLLGPYSVPPTLRDAWMEMYEKTQGDPKRMWYYCFWYGSPMSKAYTRVKLRDVTLYETAERRGIHTIDEDIAVKLEKGKKLSKVEQQVVDGFEVLELELAKKPEERVPELFREDHEALLDMVASDGDESVLESDTDDDDDYLDDDEAAKRVVSREQAPPGKNPKIVVEQQVVDGMNLVGVQLSRTPVERTPQQSREGHEPMVYADDRCSLICEEQVLITCNSEDGKGDKSAGDKKPATKQTSRRPPADLAKELANGAVDAVDIRKSESSMNKQDVGKANALKSVCELGDIDLPVSEIKHSVENAARIELGQLGEVSIAVNALTASVQNLTKDTASHSATVTQEVAQLSSSLTTVVRRVESLGSSISELTSQVQDLFKTLQKLVDQSPHSSSNQAEIKQEPH